MKEPDEFRHPKKFTRADVIKVAEAFFILKPKEPKCEQLLEETAQALRDIGLEVDFEKET
jgi:hypothetical protein